MTTTETVIPPFSGKQTDFPAWKVKFEATLTTLGLHKTIREDFKIEGTDAEQAKLTSDNERAFAYLLLALPSRDAIKLKKEKPDNAKAAYIYLNELYQSSNMLQSLHLLRELLQVKLGNSKSVEDYLDKIISMTSSINEISKKTIVDESLVTLLMLHGLTPGYTT